MAVRYRIDIENSSGTVQGSGPITSALYFQATTEMDRTGTFTFSMPAADSKASLLVERNIARCYGLLDDTWTEIGAGVIDNVDLIVDPDGEGLYNVSGMGITRELSQRSVGNLELASAGTFITHSAALDAIDDFAPAGWTITPAASPANDNVYGRFAGESVLAALIKVAEKTRTHFYYSDSRTLIFADSFADSGERAVQARGDLGDGICAIMALRRIYDTYNLKTRIIPRGAGQGDTRLTLASTDRTPVAGYTLSTANNYIENDSATATYGLDEIALQFKDIAPISNTDADVQAAANSLYDVAFEWLRRHSERGEFYEVALAECDTVLRPMQTIRVNYRDERQNIDIDTDLNILSATIVIDADGLRTTGLTVATLDRWAETDTTAIVGSIEQGQIFQALPQLNGNSYTTGYTKNVDDTETATVRFRFGDEVTQIQQVLLEFQLLQFESTVKTVALESETGTPGEIETDPASSTMGAISNNSSGASTPNDTGSASIGNTGSTAPNTGSAAGANTGSSGVTIGSAAGADSGSGGGDDTGSSSPGSGSSAPNTGGPTGGDVVSGGQHRHIVTVDDRGSAGTYSPVYHDHTGGSEIFFTVGVGFSSSVDSSLSGTHTHTTTSHTHTTAAHTHTSASHTHTTGAHTHTNAVHTHTTGAHTHTTASHTHTTVAHTHTVDHTHSLNNHTHSLNDHIHPMTPTIETIYGIFRADLADTYAIGDLEYRVNGGAWTSLDTATDVGSSWYRLDLTASLYDSDSFRPLQEANTWDVRKKAAAADDKTVTVDVLLNVRNIVQGIAYA